MITTTKSWDSLWTYIRSPKGLLAVSPAPKGEGWHISRFGRVVEDGFETEAAAIAQAEWLLS